MISHNAEYYIYCLHFATTTAPSTTTSIVTYVVFDGITICLCHFVCPVSSANMNLFD